MKGNVRNTTVRASALVLATILFAVSIPVPMFAYDETVGAYDGTVGGIISDVEKEDPSASSNVNEDGSQNNNVGEEQAIGIAIDAVNSAQGSADAVPGEESGESAGELLLYLTNPDWSADNADGQIMPADQAAEATALDLKALDDAIKGRDAAQADFITQEGLFLKFLDDNGAEVAYEYVYDENGNPIYVYVTDDSGLGISLPVLLMNPVLKDVKQKTDPVSDDAQHASENAEKANKSDDESEAREAAANAADDLQKAEKELGEAEAGLKKAEETLKQAKEKYTKLKEHFEQVKTNADSALKNSLEGAIKDSAAASAALAAAEEKATALSQEMNQAYQEVSAAKQKADDIRKRIEDLKVKGVEGVNDMYVSILVSLLESVQTAHDNSMVKVQELAPKVAKAREAVKAIDLSRFDVLKEQTPVRVSEEKTNPATEADSNEETGLTEETGMFVKMIEEAGLLTDPVPEIPVQTVSDARSLRSAGRNSSSDPGSESSEAGSEEPSGENHTDDIVPKPSVTGRIAAAIAANGGSGEASVKIENNIVPLASAPHTEVSGNGFVWAVTGSATACGAAAFLRLRRIRFKTK